MRTPHPQGWSGRSTDVPHVKPGNPLFPVDAWTARESNSRTVGALQQEMFRLGVELGSNSEVGPKLVRGGSVGFPRSDGARSVAGRP